MKGELNRTVMICVDSYMDQIPAGRFHIASLQQELPFRGLGQLLIKINDSLDREDFPQAFTELRKFRKPQDHLTDPCEQAVTNGAVATFSVRILFRQHASWQGTVTWLEGKQVECFRSVLELIYLMDNALGYEGDPTER